MDFVCKNRTKRRSEFVDQIQKRIYTFKFLSIYLWSKVSYFKVFIIYVLTV